MPQIRARLQASLGTRYRIVRELTGGGMSRVFLAEEVALEREVVVKVLAPELVDELMLERFRQEVLQTARLQHPTIVPILEAGAIEQAGSHALPFYVMPYVRGESLRSRLHHDGHLSLALTLRVMRNVLDALAFAHAHAVVHRDIKPENIFLSGSSAVLADFGIAKALRGPGAQTGRTEPGTFIGTPSYMAPEQMLDADRVGPRADLYSLGIVSYEMLTGRLPWDGLSKSEAIAAQANASFTPVRQLRPDAPAGMAVLIESCLAWDPARRPESAPRLLEQIERSTEGRITDGTGEQPVIVLPPVRPSRRRARLGWLAAAFALALTVGVLAVRPARVPALRPQRLAILQPEFATAAADPRALGGQLTQLLTTQLGPVAGLRLVGRVTITQLEAQGLSASQIADSLRAQGIDSALALVADTTGSGATTLAIELRELERDTRRTIAGPLSTPPLVGIAFDSLVAIMRQLAGQAVANLDLGAVGDAGPSTLRADAFVAWLEGRDAAARRTPDGFRDAMVHFERAMALDSTYTQARTELANAIALSLYYRYRLDGGGYALAGRALALADRAVADAPSVGDGYLSRALLGTVIGAPIAYLEENFETARRLSAGSPYLATFRAGLLARQGRHDDALALAEEELRIDPRSAGQRVASALYSLPAHQYGTTVRNGSEARLMLPEVPLVAQIEILGRLQLGGRAVADCATIAAGPYIGTRALCLERTGRAAEASRLADSLFAMLTGKAPRDSTFDLALPMGEMALYHAAHDEPDAARQWIRQAFLESPAGIDFRLMRAGLFEAPLVALADSLQVGAWSRVRSLARRNRSAR